MAAREHPTPERALTALLSELRDPVLPLQAFGGYSRTDANRLLTRAADALEQTAADLRKQISELRTALDEARERLAAAPSSEPASVEQVVGEVMVTAHRAVEAMRREVDDEANALLADARARAQAMVEEAERRAKEIDAARVKADDALARAHEEARAVCETAESKVAELEAEARRVHLVIEEFRCQWWNLISDALKQLELEVPSVDPTAGDTQALHDALRDRLAEAHPGNETKGGQPDSGLA